MIIKNGAKIAVSMPESPTLREKFAAEELIKYLGKILDTTTCPESEANVCFIIGGPARNPRALSLISETDFSAALTGEEGILIKIGEKDILIAGSVGFDDMERGTVYAVYEFLERYLGCSLTAYSHPDVDAGEFIPTRDEIEITGEYVKSGADRPYRGAIVEYGDKAGDPEHNLNIAFFDWLLKNRYNRIITWTKIYEGYKDMGLIPELERRGIKLTVGHHDAIDYWLPFFGNSNFPEHYFETHPEYYRLNTDGTRFKPKYHEDPGGQWVLCSRNEECIQTMTANLIKWISENPYTDIIALWPKDGRADQCTCEKCSPYTKVQNYVYFLFEVAKRVGKVHPHIKFDILLYTNLWTYPEGTEIPDNVFFGMSTWADKGLRCCGKPDASCLANTHFTDTLLEWKAHGTDVGFYDYYMGVFGARQRIIPMADELQALWRYFMEKDIIGTGTQLECFHIWNHLVNVCSFGRTAYDTSLSLTDNLRHICKLFGSGAPYIEEAFTYFEKINDGQATIENVGFHLMENIDKNYAYDLYEKAFAAAETVRARNNVRLMRMAFRYSDIETADPGSRQTYSWVLPYDDLSGELAYMAVNYDSFFHSKTGYGIAFPVENTDTKGFVPDKWYLFE